MFGLCRDILDRNPKKRFFLLGLHTCVYTSLNNRLPFYLSDSSELFYQASNRYEIIYILSAVRTDSDTLIFFNV